MDNLVYVTIISFAALSVFNSYVNAYAIELNLTDSIPSNFSYSLKSKIHNLISEALNGTSNIGSIINTTSLLPNGSSLASSKLVISKSNILSNTTSNTNGTKSLIKYQLTNPFKDSSSFSNSSIQGNGSNLTSSQIIISKNKIMSTMSSNGSSGDGSIIKDRVTTVNGVCNSIKIGGNSNDTLFSAGNCNDELTGGKGADKFTCGDGNDTIKDYNPKEGDIIVDRQNCEKIL
jgi:hypothetical protein